MGETKTSAAVLVVVVDNDGPAEGPSSADLPVNREHPAGVLVFQFRRIRGKSILGWEFRAVAGQNYGPGKETKKR